MACECTELLNAGCIYSLYTDVVCFLMRVEAGLFCSSSWVPASVQLLWGRCVRQLWGSTSRL